MKAIITRADKNIKEMTDITHPIIKDFAKKWDCDFIILDHKPPIMTDDNKPHYRILKTYELLDKYERVLLLDSDVIINKTCPNIFDCVHSNKIGSIYEDVGSRAEFRYKLIKNIQKRWGDVDWRYGYTNAGVFVLSYQHKDIFKSHNGEYYLGWGSADVHMSYMIHKFGFDVDKLDYKWNHMTMFSEKWNNYADRFDSYIIHYAGVGIFDQKNRIEQIKFDYKHIYGD